jgi:hypothetical protein
MKDKLGLLSIILILVACRHSVSEEHQPSMVPVEHSQETAFHPRVSFRTSSLSELVNEDFNEAFKVLDIRSDSFHITCIRDSLLFTLFENDQVRDDLDSFAVQNWRNARKFPEVILHGRFESIQQYVVEESRWLYCDSMVFVAESFDPIPR